MPTLSIIFLFLMYFLIEGKLLYTVVIISAIQHKSAIITHISSPSWASLLPGPPTSKFISEHQAGVPVLYNFSPVICYTHGSVYMEKAMAPHSSTLAWKIPWTEEPGGLHSMGLRWDMSCDELDMTERLHFHFSLSCIGEGNRNPLQCSCLENPRDGGAWWAAVYGVARSRTRLKRLSSSSSSVYMLMLLSPFAPLCPSLTVTTAFLK